MAEYVLREDDDPTDVARQLLDKTDDPQGVMWSPRPDVPGGGVYVVRDEATVAEVVRAQQQKRDDEAKRIADAQTAADERDAKADETGLTPTELGFPANAGTDPGAPGTEGTPAEVDEEDDTGDGADDPSTTEDDNLTPAQRRAAKRKAAADKQAATEQAATQEETK